MKYDQKFDRWMNRPVYKVQCATFKRCLELLKMEVPAQGSGLVTKGNHIVNEFRVLPGYRSKESQILRDMVALSIKMERLSKRIKQT